MSIYDEERKKLGIKPLGETASSSNSKNTSSKATASIYDEERQKLGIKPLSSSFKPISLEQQSQPAQQNQLSKNPLLNSTDSISNTPKKSWYDKANDFLGNVNKTLDLPLTALEKGIGAGYVNRMFFSESQQKKEEELNKHPIVSAIGQGVGSVLPFGVAGKVVGKLPFLAKEASSVAGRIGQGVVKGGLEGLLVGGATGVADEATRQIGLNDLVKGTDKRDILGNAGKTALEYGLGGVLFGGLGSAVGEGLSKLSQNRALRNIDNAYNDMSQNGMASYNRNAVQGQNRPMNLSGGINSPSNPNNPTQSNVAQNGQSGGNIPPNTHNSPQNNGRFRIVDGQQNNGHSLYRRTMDKFTDMYTNWANDVNHLNKFDRVAGGNQVEKTAMNAKKVNTTVSHIINKNLVDRNGNTISEPLKNIIDDVPREKMEDFWNYALHKHNVNRFAEGRPIDPAFDSGFSTNQAQQLEQAHPEFIDLSNRLNTFLNNFSRAWTVDTGLITQALSNDLRTMYPNYIPTNRFFSELEQNFSGHSARSGFVDQPSSIREATGSDRDIVNPLENIMNLVNRTVRTARKNEVGQQIVSAIQRNPQELQRFAEIVPNNINHGRANVDNIVTVRVGGDEVTLQINDPKFLETINAASNLPQGQGLAKINNLFKGLITQYNPIFALRNIARDLPTSYIYGTENNPLKFARDLGVAAKDLAAPSINRGLNRLGTNLRLRENPNLGRYDALGGGESNFFAPSDSTMYANDLLNPRTGIRALPRKILKGVESFNNFTEKLPRFAEFQRTLNKGGSVQDALYNSGETTVNFARGGDKAKNLDRKWVPYLNASIQGLDRFARGVKSNPIGFTGKALTVITAPTVATEIWNRSTDPEGYKNLDNRTKDNYFVFAEGDGKFLKVPKSREIAVLFSSLFQRLYRSYNGEDGGIKDSFKGFGSTVRTNFSPVNPVEANIASPFLNLKSNKDFADRDIVPSYMKDLSPNMQYDEKTSEIAKKIGEVANLSPKQIDYIIRSYTGVVGQMGLPIATKGGNTLKPLTSQFTSDSAYSNQNVTDFYDNIGKLTTAAADRNKNEDIPTNIVTPEERLKGIFVKQSQLMAKLRKAYQDGTEEEKRQAQKEIADLSKSMNQMLKK